MISKQKWATISALIVSLALAAIFLQSELKSDTVPWKGASLSPAWTLQRIGEAIPEGISEYTYGLALSPDRRRIATVGDRLRFWDVESGKPIGEPLALSGQSVAWRPDGATVAIGSLDGQVVLADANEQRVLWQMSTGKQLVPVIAFSPDGKLIAASNNDDNAVRILSADGKEVCLGEPAHLKGISGIVFAEGGKSIATVSMDGTLRVWDPATCKELRPRIESKNGFFRMLALHPNGQIVAVAGREGPTVNDQHGGVEFWDIKSGQMVAAPIKGYGGVYGIGGLAFSEDGNKLMVADSSGALALVDWKTGALLGRGLAHHNSVIVWRTLFSPKGDLIATAGKDRVLGLWSAHITADSPLQLSLPKEYSFDGTLPVFSDDGRVVAFTRENHVVVRKTDGNKEIMNIDLKNRVFRIALSPNGDYLAAQDSSMPHLWNVPSKRMVGDLKYPGTEAAVFTADNKRLAIGANSGVYLIDCESGQEIASYKIGSNPHYPRIVKLAFDPAGKRLYATTTDGDVHRLDAATLRPVGEMWQGLNRNGVLAFSKDGSRVAVSRNGSHGDITQIVVMDAASGVQFSNPFKVFLVWKQAIAFTPDQNHLLMAGEHGMVSLWDYMRGQPLAQTTLGHQGQVRDITFSSDLQQLTFCEMGTYTRTDCRAWDVSLRLSDADAVASKSETMPALLSADATTRIAMGSLSNSINSETNELALPREMPLLLLRGADIPRLYAAVKDHQSNAQARAMLYSDSAVSADGSIVSVPLYGNQLAMFDTHTAKLLNVLENVQGGHVFLADGTLAIDQGAKGIRIVNPSSGDDLNMLAYPVQGTLTAMQAGSKSPTIVFGNSEGSLFIFHSIAPATPVSVVGNVHRGPIYTLALSPDERMLASGGADGRIQLLDMQTATPISSTSVAHDTAITAIGFSPDGSVLASGSTDGVIRVWNAKTGQPISLFMTAHAAPVIAIAFDANGSRLFSLGNDSNLNVWTLPHASK